MPSFPKQVLVAARESPLSKAQFSEVQSALRQHHPQIELIPRWISTTGDRNLQISLRSLGKTDFFTKEVDELLLTHACQVAIHSAKDLPEVIPEGLNLVALTQGLDPRDVIVLRPNEAFETLKKGAVIATSSERREERVQALRTDLQFIDLRGTIEQRIDFLFTGEADGVVVAEAALQRLGLVSLNRFYLPGETTPFQGQLAIMARSDDQVMNELFYCLDSRQVCHASST